MKKPKIAGEFKKFLVQGNVIDLAVGVIIGGAFGKIITSLVNDIIMPLISLITGEVNIASLALTVAANAEGEPISVNYGMFLQNILDFIIIALCIFIMVKAVQSLRKRRAEEEPAPAPPEPPETEKLLAEIRDILKERK